MGISSAVRPYDEMLEESGRPRAVYRRLHRTLLRAGRSDLARRHRLAQRAFRDHGITFTVSQRKVGIERIFPFDLIPRIIDPPQWSRIEAGLKQRVTALNHFLEDVYGEQRILRQGVVPAEIVLSSAGFRRELVGLSAPHGVRCHVAGVDLVLDHKGEVHVLEDNLRTPSGISYVLANRQVLKRIYPELFVGHDVLPVDGYTHQLLQNLRWLAPGRVDEPTVVLLTPGIFNSAYFEHLFLAKQMGIELVEGSDLVVDQDHVFMRTTAGLRPVHVIYRRVDDDFLDPVTGRTDSVIGVPGLVNAYRAGKVSIANGLGNAVADDKAVYALVPQLIRYYLGEEAILPNVPTYLCARQQERTYVLEHLHELVVKTVGESGGHGMLIGPASTAGQRERMRRRIQARPRDFVAQPVVSLSVQPALFDGALASRHQDLRPFVLTGREVSVTPGGLTRVALRAGSLVVNSSQGGGSRDTWVLGSPGARDAAAE
ncbi:MAG: circularly permuted type 2 ATP-grasp protein [Candidatus Dormibacter sp.]|uniref:circularly permuted type 2 ATP-grasp protein n=1 Tax=Candidatus Dormibacter sp. TaxID=2973982 RepID=UPI002692A75C